MVETDWVGARKGRWGLWPYAEVALSKVAAATQLRLNIAMHVRYSWLLAVSKFKEKLEIQIMLNDILIILKQKWHNCKLSHLR